MSKKKKSGLTDIEKTADAEASAARKKTGLKQGDFGQKAKASLDAEPTPPKAHPDPVVSYVRKARGKRA